MGDFQADFAELRTAIKAEEYAKVLDLSVALQKKVSDRVESRELFPPRSLLAATL